MLTIHDGFISHYFPISICINEVAIVSIKRICIYVYSDLIKRCKQSQIQLVTKVIQVTSVSTRNAIHTTGNKNSTNSDGLISPFSQHSNHIYRLNSVSMRSAITKHSPSPTQQPTQSRILLTTGTPELLLKLKSTQLSR